MFRFILILIVFLTFQVRADFLGFKSGGPLNSKIPGIVEKLKSLEMSDGPMYEDSFNQSVKSIENTLEEEKLFCAGEAPDASGKVLTKDKQLCFRELKSSYLDAMEVIFDLKKKYLGLIHNRQIQKLSEIQKKLKEDIEKSF
jgi:hypothetical protein